MERKKIFRAVIAVVTILVFGLGANLLAQTQQGTKGSEPKSQYGWGWTHHGKCPYNVSSMEPVKLNGKIKSIDFPKATLKTKDGKNYILRLGPWSYWKSKGYELKEGETVEVNGYKTDGGFIIPMSIKKASGQEIKLRKKNGCPYWSSQKECMKYMQYHKGKMEHMRHMKQMEKERGMRHMEMEKERGMKHMERWW